MKKYIILQPENNNQTKSYMSEVTRAQKRVTLFYPPALIFETKGLMDSICLKKELQAFQFSTESRTATVLGNPTNGNYVLVKRSWLSDNGFVKDVVRWIIVEKSRFVELMSEYLEESGFKSFSYDFDDWNYGHEEYIRPKALHTLNEGLKHWADKASEMGDEIKPSVVVHREDEYDTETLDLYNVSKVVLGDARKNEIYGIDLLHKLKERGLSEQDALEAMTYNINPIKPKQMTDEDVDKLAAQYLAKKTKNEETGKNQ